MRVRRVCDAGMEKQLNDLSMLTHYQNRQVILNYYHDVLLYKREGFHFLLIQLTETAVIFTKLDGTTFTLEHSNYPCSYMSIPIAKARGFERIVFKSTIVFTWATTSPATTSGRSLQLCMSIFHDDDFLWSLKELVSFQVHQRHSLHVFVRY